VVCQYSNADSDLRASFINQTWLAFDLIQVNKLGEVYVASKRLDFRGDVLNDQFVNMFDCNCICKKTMLFIIFFRFHIVSYYRSYLVRWA
jgi:hypothetical protein